MAFLQSNIPYFKCWVRKEYTHNHIKYHGEFIHAMAVAVTTMPCRSLSFQMIFTGAETYDDDDEPNVHGGAMWARMPITGLVADTPLEEWPEPMPTWEEGKAVVFDDTYEHMAVNMTNRDRVVLFLDYMRPLPAPLSWLNHLVVYMARFMDYFKEPIKRHKEWEKTFYKDAA